MLRSQSTFRSQLKFSLSLLSDHLKRKNKTKATPKSLACIMYFLTKNDWRFCNCMARKTSLSLHKKAGSIHLQSNLHHSTPYISQCCCLQRSESLVTSTGITLVSENRTNPHSDLMDESL